MTLSILTLFVNSAYAEPPVALPPDDVGVEIKKETPNNKGDSATERHDTVTNHSSTSPQATVPTTPRKVICYLAPYETGDVYTCES